MPRSKIGFDTVREIGLALPGVGDGTTYGAPALKVHGKMFACLPTHPSAEPDSLAIRIDFRQRDELLAEDPNTYYIKDHYANYPVVLVRLTRVHPDTLRDLLLLSHRFVSSRDKRRTTRKRAARHRSR